MYRATAKEKTKCNDNKNIMTNTQKSSEVKKVENNSSKVTRSSKSVDNNDITVNNSYDTHKCDNDGYTIVSRKSSSTTNAKRKQTRTIDIIGDSMIKNVQPYKMRRKISPNEKLL